MSTLQINNITWQVSTHQGKTVFQHHNIKVSTDYRKVSQVFSGELKIYEHSSRSQCLKIGTEIVMDAYASIIRPCWE